MESDRKNSILIVEDDANIRSALTIFLDRLGFEVQDAANGLAGLEKAEKHAFDIIISDIIMPEMNGLQFLEEVKRVRPECDVIMITGYGDMNIAIEAMKLGAADFITKPFQFEYLEGIIKDLMARRKSTMKSDAKDFNNLQLHLEKKVKEISILYSINEALENVEEAGEIFEKLCALSVNICSAESAAYYIFDQEAQSLTHHKTYPETTRNGRLAQITLPELLATKLTVDREPLHFRDTADIDVFRNIIGPSLPRPSSALLVPFYVRREFFGILSVEGKVGAAQFTGSDITFVKMLMKKAGMAIENTALYETIYDNLLSTLLSLVSTIEAKDPYTRSHSARVTRLSVLIAQEMGCSQEEIDTLKFAGMLHDIGKIGVSDSILLKSGPLTEAEFQAIKAHPVIGAKILGPLGMLPQEKAIIRHHHERWDGNGYPDGLSGKEIPYLVRILTVADSYDAMTSDRVYRQGLTHQVAVNEFERNSWKQFDGNVTNAFFSLCRKLNQNLRSYLSNDAEVRRAS